VKVSVSSEVFRKFNPDLKIALIYIQDFNPKENLLESQHLLGEGEELVKLEFHPDTLKNHELISPWAAAQQEFGKEAQHYHTSIERLLRQVLNHKSISTKDTLTNLLHYLSLKYVVPIGVDDAQKINGELHFGIAQGKERAGLLALVKKGAFYYHDQKGVLGTKFDYWKGSRTEVTPKTTSALIHVEAVPPLGSKELNLLLTEIKALIISFCGGKIKVVVLDKKKSSAVL